MLNATAIYELYAFINFIIVSNQKQKLSGKIQTIAQDHLLPGAFLISKMMLWQLISGTSSGFPEPVEICDVNFGSQKNSPLQHSKPENL